MEEQKGTDIVSGFHNKRDKENFGNTSKAL